MELLDLEGLRSDSGVIRTHTRVTFKFYPHNDPVMKRKLDRRIVSSDPRESEASFRTMRWSKTLGQPAGQWQATFKDHSMGLGNGAVLPGDWCFVEIQRNGVSFPLCLGVVETVRRRNTVERSGKRTQLWTMTGFDHGIVFNTVLAYQSLWIRPMSRIARGFMTEKVSGRVGANPKVMFDVLLNAALTKGTESSIWKLPPALADEFSLSSDSGFLDALEVPEPSTELRGWYGNQVRLWTNPGETLYSAMQFWCHSLLNEIILDVDYNGAHGMSPFAVIRERPFPNTTDGMDSEWFALPLITLPLWATNDDDLGWSNGERFNLVELFANYNMIGHGKVDQGAACPAKWDRRSIEIHGLRPMQQETQHWGAWDKGEFFRARTEWQDLLVDWNCLNPYFLSGSIAVPFALPEARIGNVLVTKGNGGIHRQFYIEGVELSISAPTAGSGVTSSTQLSVTRGWTGGDQSLLKALGTASGAYSMVGAGEKGDVQPVRKIDLDFEDPIAAPEYGSGY